MFAQFFLSVHNGHGLIHVTLFSELMQQQLDYIFPLEPNSENSRIPQ